MNRILLRHDVFIFISIEKSESIDRQSFKLAHLSCARVSFPKLSNSALNTATQARKALHASVTLLLLLIDVELYSSAVVGMWWNCWLSTVGAGKRLGVPRGLN